MSPADLAAVNLLKQKIRRHYGITDLGNFYGARPYFLESRAVQVIVKDIPRWIMVFPAIRELTPAVAALIAGLLDFSIPIAIENAWNLYQAAKKILDQSPKPMSIDSRSSSVGFRSAPLSPSSFSSKPAFSKISTPVTSLVKPTLFTCEALNQYLAKRLPGQDSARAVSVEDVNGDTRINFRDNSAAELVFYMFQDSNILSAATLPSVAHSITLRFNQYQTLQREIQNC